MNIIDIIQKKRDGGALSKEEIEYFINEYVNGNIPDYQISSLLMAIYFQGLTDEELTDLTMAMVNSGDRIDLSGIEGKKVDKHSTGGIGDKTTLIVAPIVASVGCRVAKMSGRGLGFTGGTADKLESIEGYRINIPMEDFIRQVNEIGIGLISQSGNLTPADKKIYSLRDVTGTVESIPLIASSVMSKKIAAGADSIVLDVKMGSGAFMKTLERARELSQKMVNIGKLANRKTIALITNMDIPLGQEIGNALEVKESIEVLKGNGPEDLKEICIELAKYMVVSGLDVSIDKAEKMVKESISSGAAFEKFKELVRWQGGNEYWIENPDCFPKALYSEKVRAYKSGYMKSMNAEEIGKVSLKLGAGREYKEQEIDYSAGVTLLKKTGDFVEIGDVVAILHTNREEVISEASKRYLDSLEFSNEPVEKPKLIYEVIGG